MSVGLILNYWIMAQFAVLAIFWLALGDRMQALYWFGAFACSAGVTFKA